MLSLSRCLVVLLSSAVCSPGGAMFPFTNEDGIHEETTMARRELELSLSMSFSMSMEVITDSLVTNAPITSPPMTDFPSTTTPTVLPTVLPTVTPTTLPTVSAVTRKGEGNGKSGKGGKENGKKKKADDADKFDKISQKGGRKETIGKRRNLAPSAQGDKDNKGMRPTSTAPSVSPRTKSTIFRAPPKNHVSLSE